MLNHNDASGVIHLCSILCHNLILLGLAFLQNPKENEFWLWWCNSCSNWLVVSGVSRIPYRVLVWKFLSIFRVFLCAFWMSFCITLNILVTWVWRLALSSKLKSPYNCNASVFSLILRECSSGCLRAWDHIHLPLKRWRKTLSWWQKRSMICVVC